MVAKWNKVNGWEGENFDFQFTKIYDCGIKDGAIEIIGSLAGISRLPFFTAELLISGIGCIYILFNLKTMYRSLLTGNPFVEKNISCFRKIAITCFAVAIVYIVKAVLDFTLATIIIAIIFIVGCLFCLTLKDLFKQAINYKVENDLTI